MDARIVTDDLIEVNVAGRLMLLLTRHGLLDNRCLSIYQRAVGDVVRLRLAQQVGGGCAGIDRILDEQLAMLESALTTRRRTTVVDQDAAVPVPDESKGAVSAQSEAQQKTPHKRKPRDESICLLPLQHVCDIELSYIRACFEFRTSYFEF